MLVLLLLVCCMLLEINGSEQPYPLKIEKMSSCCEYLVDTENLYTCVRNSSGMDSSNFGSLSKVVLLSSAVTTVGSHAMNDLRNFTQYQLTAVSAYAEHNGYVYKSLDEPEDAEHEPEDIRWNKIRLLSNALDPEEGWARNADFIVWIDADAIILDFGLYVEDIGSEFPLADIIASADLRMGLINTGFMVIRNTAWTREFLNRWWTVADRSVVCDQDAFDLLYKEYLTEEKHSGSDSVTNKVKILAMDRLNSHPPAMLHQQPHNPILHLMGESTAMRTAVFRHAAEEVCAAVQDPSHVLAPQLGISREFLLQTASTVYKAEVDRRLIEASDVTTAGPSEFDKLSLSAHHYCDILEHLVEQLEKNEASPSHWNEIKRYKSEILTLRKQVLKLSLANVEHRKEAIAARTENQVIISDVESMTNYALMLKRAAESGNDVYRSIEDYEEKKHVGKQVLKICDALLEAVSEESKFVPKHMKALMTQSLGKLEYDRSMGVSLTPTEQQSGLKAALKALKKSLKYFEEAQELQDNSGTARTEHSMSLQMVAGITCQLGDRQTGTQLWLNAVSQAEASTNGVEMGVHFDALPSVYLNAAICFAEAGQTDQSQEFIDKAVTSYTKSASNRSGLSVGSRELKRALKNDEFLSRAETLLSSIRSMSTSSSKKTNKKPVPKTEAEKKPTVDTASTIKSASEVGDVVIEWEECDDFQDCEDEAVSSNASAEPLFTADDESIYAGLTKYEAKQLREVRERYARTASRYYVNRRSGDKLDTDFVEKDQGDNLNEAPEVLANPHFSSSMKRQESTVGNDKMEVKDASRTEKVESGSDETGLYDGLSAEEVEDLKERRARYAEQAKRFNSAIKDEEPSSGTTTSAALASDGESACDAKKVKRLEFRVKQLELELTAAHQQNKILQEKLALLESYMKD